LASLFDLIKNLFQTQNLKYWISTFSLGENYNDFDLWIMLKTIWLLFMLGFQVLKTSSQDSSHPEIYNITGFPSLNQSIYGG